MTGIGCLIRRTDAGTEWSLRRSSNKRRHSYAGPSAPPREFFCPISRSLMTEPVKLMNTGVTLNRTSLQDWLRKGLPLCHPCCTVNSLSFNCPMLEGPL